MSCFRDFSGTNFVTESGGIGYRRAQDGHDGHGGRAAEHRAEMEQIAERIAQQKIAEMIPEIQRAAYISAYNDVVNALSFDVTTAVSVAFENGAQIFYDSRTQRVIEDAVMSEVRKGLSQIK